MWQRRQMTCDGDTRHPRDMSANPGVVRRLNDGGTEVENQNEAGDLRS